MKGRKKQHGWQFDNRKHYIFRKVQVTTEVHTVCPLWLHKAGEIYRNWMRTVCAMLILSFFPKCTELRVGWSNTFFWSCPPSYTENVVNSLCWLFSLLFAQIIHKKLAQAYKVMPYKWMKIKYNNSRSHSSRVFLKSPLAVWQITKTLKISRWILLKELSIAKWMLLMATQNKSENG